MRDSTGVEVGGTVLIVDDTPSSLILLAGVLEDAGYTVKTATSGAAALKVAADTQPDLVLLDVAMPEMDGFEVCRRIKADDALREIPVVFLTALADTADKVRAFEVGGADYVTKPFQVEEVFARVHAHVALRRVRRALMEQKVDEARREEEDKFARVFMATPAGMAMTRIDDGLIIEANDAFARVFGYERSDIIGQTTLAMGMWFTPEARMAIIERIKSVEGDLRDHEVVLRARDGRALVTRWSSVILDVRGDEVLVTSLVDITAKKRAEEALQLSQRKLAAIFREIPVALTVSDAETGRLYDVNPAFVRLVAAKSADELIDKTTIELGLMSETDRQRHLVEPVLLGRTRGLVVPARRLNGEPYWAEVSVSAYDLDDKRYLIAGTVDITDRLRAEQERNKAELQYRELFDGVRDVVFSMTPSGTITMVNPAFANITGLQAQDWVGKPFVELLHPDDREVAEQRLREILTGRQSRTDPLRVRTAAGNFLFVEVSTSPRHEEGRVVSLFGIGRDVTERVTLEQQLRQSQKMEAIGQLAGGIAHDFNNLLTVIIGLGQLLLIKQDRPPAEKTDLEQMVKAAERAAGVTRQLLAFSRRQVIELRDVQLNDVLHNIEKMLNRIIGENVVLKTNVAKGLGIIRADPGQLDQVIVNLAVNARDAMPDGGTLSMTTSNVTLDSAFVAANAGSRAGNFVRLSVRDTGTGMTPEVKARIWEPFFTTKGVGKGTGLGLPTVFGIVKQANGYVAVTSEVGQGTSFDMYFPRAEPQAVAAASAAERDPLGGTETVLVAEDTAPLRDLTTRVLRGYGYTVLEAGDGEEAMAVAEKHEGTIDLLITDVVMPGMSGRALADGLARVRPGLRVLYVSGYPEDVLGKHGIMDAGLTLLAKPFTPVALAEKVRERLAR